MKQTVIILILLFCFGLKSQSIERSVISSGGNTFSNTNFSADWTIGELAVSSAVVGATMLTQGFNQYYSSALSVKNSLVISSLKAYPNAVESKLNLSWENKKSAATLDLYDATGKLVYTTNWNNGENLQIDFSSYSSGIYSLKVVSDGKTNTMRISKI